MDKRPSAGQSSGHLDLQQLGEWIDRVTIPSYDITTGLQDTRGGFVPRKQVRAYFTQDRYRTITSILRVVLGNHSSEVSPRGVAENCSRLFCILYLIGKAHFIHTLAQKYNLFDEYLPFWSRPPHFPKDPNDGDDEAFFKAFYETQWRFCAPQLRPNGKVHYDPNLLLPITSLERTASGNFGIVYKAMIHSSHDELVSQKSPQALQTVPSGRCCAIKTLHRANARGTHDRESTAFTQVTEDGMRSTPGMIQFFGSFSFKQTFKIVLEYADRGNLEDYFKTTQAPENPQDTIAFWTHLLEITKAISSLHAHPIRLERDGQTTVQTGWHQDLKPENILVLSTENVSPYECLFKIADLGLVRLRTSVLHASQDFTAPGAFGTVTYGAPECYAASQSSRNVVSDKVDIWSMACIFSEAAVWTKQGWAGVEKYRKVREEETDTIAGFTGGDCFHDGEHKLKTVERTHRMLERELESKPDYITGAIIHRLIAEMLHEDPELRPKSKIVQKRAESLLNQGHKGLDEADLKRVSVLSDGSQSKTCTQGVSRAKGQIGVQFVMFGNDPAGRNTLQALDSYGATLDPPLDIVDFEPANGNVWKILLGAINDLFDDDDDGEDTRSGPNIPTNRRSHEDAS